MVCGVDGIACNAVEVVNATWLKVVSRDLPVMHV